MPDLKIVSKKITKRLLYVSVLGVLSIGALAGALQPKSSFPIDIYRFWLAGRMLSDPTCPPIYTAEARHQSREEGEELLDEPGVAGNEAGTQPRHIGALR